MKRFFSEVIDGRCAFDKSKLRIKRKDSSEWESVTVREADYIDKMIEEANFSLDRIFDMMGLHLPEHHTPIEDLTREVIQSIIEDTIRLSPGLLKHQKSIVSSLLTRPPENALASWHPGEGKVMLRFDPTLFIGSPLCKPEELVGRVTLDVLTVLSVFSRLPARVREWIEIEYQKTEEPVEFKMKAPEEVEP